MGDPKKQRKRYQTPSHPWQKERIEEEREIKKGYGLKNKKELWKMKSFLRRFKNYAKRLSSIDTAQKEKEKIGMIKRLQKLGILKENGQIDDVLGLSLKDVLERRIQTILLRKGLARTINQARQFIAHRHVIIGSKKITSPSYIVSREEEAQIGFYANSSLSSEEHAERVVIEKKKVKRSKERLEKRKRKGNNVA